ncbi:MAG: FKBP-type peptidyl-prolyl cis-trans isomerase [Chitinophagaceae bacterium]|nr:FKBP-type peptidyl-prolyl cis-trans isomerase [Chitinophagaceae bacterium]
MKKICLTALTILSITLVFSQPKKSSKTKNIFKDLRDSTSYALGVNIGQNLKAQNLDGIDPLVLYKGLSDVLLKKTLQLNEADASRCVNTYVQKINSFKASAVKQAGQKFLAENAKKPGVISMPGGWQYQILKQGESAEHPSPNDRVKCHYHGMLIDGTVFDSSVERGEPMTFGLNQVIRGWTVSVPMMTVGSKWRIFLPSDLAYGDNAAGEKIPGGSALIFEIELLAIEK